MLQLKELTLKLGGQTVLNKVSLRVESEIHIVIGLNGSGKSSLLKTIAGIWKLDKGSVFINGRDISRLPPEDRRVGYVPQHQALFRNMSIEQNIRYCLRNKRGKEARIDSLIDMLDLRDVLAKHPATLSGGYQSRVSLARTLASEPEVMLLDEPLSDLDVSIKERLIPTFKAALKAQSIPVLYVTHDALEATLLGESFSLMTKGELSTVESAQDGFAILANGLARGASQCEGPTSADRKAIRVP